MVRNDETLAEVPPPASPRAFGVLMAVICGILAALPLIHGHLPNPWLSGLGVVLLGIAWLRPALLAPANRLWLRFGAVLHKGASLLILGALFFAVLTPLALLSRLGGGDRLRLKRLPAGQSYWLDCPPTARPDFDKPY